MANIAKTDPKGPVNANIRLSRNSPTGYKRLFISSTT